MHEYVKKYLQFVQIEYIMMDRFVKYAFVQFS